MTKKCSISLFNYEPSKHLREAIIIVRQAAKENGNIVSG